MKHEKLNDIKNLVMDVFKSVSKRKQESERSKISKYMGKILLTVHNDAGLIRGIGEFKDSLKENTDPQNKVKEEMTRIFDDIEKELEERDKQPFKEALQSRMKVHEAKSEVVAYVKKKILSIESGKEIDDRDFPNDSVELLGLKDNVEKLKRNWKKIDQLVTRTEESYGKLVKEMEKLQSSFSPTGVIRAFEIFMGCMNLTRCRELVLQVITKHCNKLLQDNFDNRLRKLQSLFTDEHVGCIHEYMQDKSLQAAVEMLVLDLLEVLEIAGFFADDRLFLDGPSPVLLGKSLRNYLAHGDALIDCLELDPALAIISNALRLITEGNDLIKIQNSLIGQRIAAECDVMSQFNEQLNIVTKQKEMFCAARTGDLINVQQCINDTDIRGRDVNKWSGLHFAAQGGNVEVLKYFIDNGLNVDCKDASGKNAVHIAAEFGSIDIVMYLLEGKYSGTQDKDLVGKTPLHYAAQNNHKEVVVELAKNSDIKINALDKDKATPLHLSAQNGHKDIVQVLLSAEGCDVNSETDDGRTPLHFAAQNGHEDVVDLLLTTNLVDCKVDALAHEDWTPLHFAAQNGHLGIVTVLLEKKAEINAQTSRKFTPLHYAACNGQRDVVEYLAQRTCVNVAGQNGMTPLHMAAMNDHNDVVVLLLGMSAKLDSLDTYDRTPVHMAVLMGHKEVVETLLNDKTFVDSSGEIKRILLDLAAEKGQNEVVKVLLSHGVNDDVSENEDTPLHLASKNGHAIVVETLLERGASVNVKGDKEWTALHYAALKGHADVVDVLLRYEADVNAQTENKWTALHHAASKGHKAIVDALIANKANVTMKEENGWTALHYAALHDWRSIIEALSQRIQVDFVGDNYFTPLHAAALNGNKDSVKLLLQKGADINARAIDERTPLYMAALNGHKDVVEVLLQKRAKVDLVAKNNDTALHCAARNGYKFIVALLLGKGIGVNARGIDGKTPLHEAARNGHKDIVELLLKEDNIDVNPPVIDNPPDSDNATPIHLAAKFGHRQVLEVLLQNKSDVKSVDKTGLTVLHYAVANGYLDIVGVLLDTEGVPVDGKGECEFTPLHIAALRGYKEIVVALLRKGADVNVQDPTGYTALHMAAGDGQKDIVEMLLKEKAKVEILTKCKWTALHYAAQSGHADVVSMLMRQEKCNANAVDDDHMTPLHLAAQEGHKQVVDVLLNGPEYDKSSVEGLAAQSVEKPTDEDVSIYGENIEVHHLNEVTPLKLPGDCGHKDDVKVVSRRKAEVDVRNVNGETPLHLTAQIGRKDIVEVLLNHGADYVARNNHDAVLHRAVSSNNTDVIRLILGKITEMFGDDSARTSEYINAQDSEGDTPLMWAAEKGNVNAAKAILELQWVDVGIKNEKGMTALHRAVASGSLEMVLLLIMNGANVDDTDNDLNTVLHYVPLSNS